MSMLQVRNLSEETHQALRVRAAQAGQSLSAYVAESLERQLAVPTMDEFLERIRLRGSVEPAISAADMLAEQRQTRW